MLNGWSRTHTSMDTRSGKSCHRLVSITRTHDAIHQCPLQGRRFALIFPVGIAKHRHCSTAGVYIPALPVLTFFSGDDQIAWQYPSCESDGARSEGIDCISDLHTFRSMPRWPRDRKHATKPIQPWHGGRPRTMPLHHFMPKACCYGSAHEMGNGFTTAKCVSRDQTPRCILVVAAA